MKKMKEWFVDVFIYAGITKNEYEEIKFLIQKKNTDVLIRSSIVASVLLLILFIESFFSSTISVSQHLYAWTLLAVLFIIILSNVVLKKRPHLTLLVYYLFLTIVFVFAIILGAVIQQTIPATTFCVLLFALPLMIIDKPYRMSLYLLIISEIFCKVSFHYKEHDIASLDWVNVMSFLFLAIIVNVVVVRTKMRDLAQRCYIEKEKDTDELTQLLTKAATEREIRYYIENSKDKAALLILDIDNFKHVNDTWGHTYGDAVIRIMGQCIKKAFRKSDVLGRFGGDEFVIFLPHMGDVNTIIQRVEFLVEQMNEKLINSHSNKPISGSIGIALYPDDDLQYQELFKRADEALYESKRKGKNCYTFYRREKERYEDTFSNTL
jgi:diguanylate cyclase (GGDEF)-like protein